MNVSFDVIIIGAGQAGPALAGRMTGAGLKVALVERKLFGGTCVNTGCIPTKALVASAYAAHVARRAAEFGIKLEGTVGIDMAAVKGRKDQISGDARRSVESWLRGLHNCTLFEGHACFVSATEVRVNGDVLEAPRIFINVGARAVVPPLPGIGDVPFLTNTTILALDRVPAHLVVIGGSYIGLEFAQIHRRFGARVTVIEKGPRLLAGEDEDVSWAIQAILEAEGISVRLDAECIRVQSNGDMIEVGVSRSGDAPTLCATHVLLAVGRRPNTDDLGLKQAGVRTDEHGFIVVDDKLQSSVPGIWALGDCNGRGAFTHTAYNDYEIVAANLLDNEERLVSERLPVYALYIDPPLGRVGMTQAQACAAGVRVRVGQRSMERVGRAVEKCETAGFMKVVVNADTGAILGAAILGVGGDEAIHGIIDTMSAGGDAGVLRRTVHIHPTVSELIPTMLGKLKP